MTAAVVTAEQPAKLHADDTLDASQDRRRGVGSHGQRKKQRRRAWDVEVVAVAQA